MKWSAVVVDTSVVVAGLLTRDADSPTARIVDGMVLARFPFVLATALLAEYRRVLLRPRVRSLHGLTTQEVDEILTVMARHAMVREPRRAAEPVPDPGDRHLWDLLAAVSGAVLVTGDAKLLESTKAPGAVVRPADLVETLETGSPGPE